ncbi:MAG: arsenate reductase ArsC [Actinomycetota bacterium]
MNQTNSGVQLAKQLARRSTAVRLAERLGDHFTYDTVAAFVDEVHDELEERFRIKTHVPTFAHRFARERLEALARHEGRITDHRPTVLFVCERNDDVSQIAAALLRERAGDRAHVHSAGTQPADELHVAAVHALHELEIEMISEFPKPLTPEIEADADVIVTLDRNDRVDLVMNDTTQYFAWDVPADHGDDLEAYVALCHTIERLVIELEAAVLAPVAG